MSPFRPIPASVTDGLAVALKSTLRAYQGQMAPEIEATCRKAVQDYDRAQRAMVGLPPREYPDHNPRLEGQIVLERG